MFYGKKYSHNIRYANTSCHNSVLEVYYPIDKSFSGMGGKIMSVEYKKETEAIDTEKTLQLLNDVLPDFCRIYYNEREIRLSPKTQYDYACKMKIFLEYLHNNNSYFAKKTIKEITIDDMAKLTQEDFTEFVSWLLKQNAVRSSEKIKRKNSKSTAENYLASLSSYMAFLAKKKFIPQNPLYGIDREKKKTKPIIYLREDDRTDFVNTVNTGTGLSNRQKAAWERNNLRDTCMMMILLDTGIRVSELVGLDIYDVDLKHFKLSVQRKGDKPDNVYYSDTVADILIEYLALRKQLYQPADDEYALFLVGIGKYKGTRISVRSVELMVKKFARAAGVSDWHKITPHKLRSTYAMAMLKATGNQAIVQEQLGHENVATTALYSRGTEEDKIENRNNIF